MADDRDQIYNALRQADAAGDVEAATKLASYLQSMSAGPAIHTFSATGTDGKPVQFQLPENADDATVRAAAVKALGGDQRYSRAAINRGGDITPNAPDTREPSFLQGAGEGLYDVLNHAADKLTTGLNAGGEALGLGRVGDAFNSLGPSIGAAGSVEEARQNQQRAFASQPNKASGLGRFVGEGVGMAPLALLPGGLLAQGAAGGALMSDAKSVGGLALDAGLGAAAGRAGGALFNGAAKLANPILSPALQTLVQAGVKVTPGQVARSGNGLANRMFAAAEDRAMSLPGVGDMITNDRVNANASFNAAAIGRALEPIGAALPKGMSAGRRAIRYAGDTLSKAYDAVLPKLTATGDSAFANDLANIHADAATMAPARVQQFNSILGSLDRYWKPGNVLDGEAFKAIETRIGEKARRFSRSQDADQQELGEALNSVLESVRSLAARQNPSEASRIQAINQGWKSLTQVERAGLTTKGEFGPAGYSQAVRRSSSTTRSRGYARGTELNQDLSDAASDILPSEIPDSGTSGRWAQSNLLALGAGALGSVPYAAARGVNRLVTRPRGLSPNLARMLEYAAKSAPALTAGPITDARERLAQ